MDYDIAGAFEDIEMALIKSMRNNMKRHINEEYDEGMNWTQWQAEMLSGLSQYRSENKELLKGYMGRINAEIDAVIREAYATGESELEIELLEAIKRGYEPPRDGSSVSMQGAFFRTNKNKLDALIYAVDGDMNKAETAMLRMTDDIYRQTLFRAQMFYNTGAGNMWQCVDMATRDFLASGINCVQYANGARVNIASYAEMALRTANKRANLMGQAMFREKYGIHTVKVNARGTACPRCLPFLGQVFIDDVYGGGTEEESAASGYPLLSSAVANGLYHPNCKDSCSTYYEGISREPQEITEEQAEETLRRYNLEQQQRYYERNYKRNMRLGNGCLDKTNAGIYFRRAEKYKSMLIELCEDNQDVLRLDRARLSLRGVLVVDNEGRISIANNAPKKATDLGSELQKKITKYTDGGYSGICDYSQYIVDKRGIQNELEWFEQNRLPEISEDDRDTSRELLKIISEQPTSERTLYRLERGLSDANEGDTITLGIRSATRDAEFAGKVYNQSMEGFDFDSNNFNGKWTEYRFISSKSLDISDISVYKAQQEELIAGTFEVVRTETIKNIRKGTRQISTPMRELAENVEEYTAKTGRTMVRYTYNGKQLIDPVDKFNTRMVTKYVDDEGQFGRKIVWLKIKE